MTAICIFSFFLYITAFVMKKTMTRGITKTSVRPILRSSKKHIATIKSTGGTTVVGMASNFQGKFFFRVTFESVLRSRLTDVTFSPNLFPRIKHVILFNVYNY